MKSFVRVLPALATLVSSFLVAAPLRAQNSSAVSVVKPIVDLTVPVGTTRSKVKLNKTFGFTVGSNSIPCDVVRFATTLGNIDVQLFPDVAPNTVANFLGYVSRGDYNASFIHRLVAGFVVQGGGYKFVNDAVETISTQDPVVNEFNLSNVRGTIAMAKLGNDPDSATDQWFFNLADNSGILDGQNGGFTVFGQVVNGGLKVVDAIAALSIVNATSPFDQLPTVDAIPLGGNVGPSDLLYVNSISVLPLLPAVTGDPAVLKLAVLSNTNSGLVTPTLNGSKLILIYAPGVKGTATITVQAKGPVKGAKTKTKFNVTVQ